MLNSRVLKRSSVAIFFVGIALAIFMIYAESEPGALPLFLILLGAGGYGFAWHRSYR